MYKYTNNQNLIANKKKELALLMLLIITAIYFYLNVSKSFYVSGGSCYQGITASINIIIFKVCIVLNFAAIILLLFKTKIILSKILSIASAFIWSIWSIVIIQEAKGNELFYFAPFLIVTFLIVFVNLNSKKKLEK